MRIAARSVKLGGPTRGGSLDRGPNSKKNARPATPAAKTLDVSAVACVSASDRHWRAPKRAGSGPARRRGAEKALLRLTKGSPASPTRRRAVPLVRDHHLPGCRKSRMEPARPSRVRCESSSNVIRLPSTSGDVMRRLSLRDKDDRVHIGFRQTAGGREPPERRQAGPAPSSVTSAACRMASARTAHGRQTWQKQGRPPRQKTGIEPAHRHRGKRDHTRCGMAAAPRRRPAGGKDFGADDAMRCWRGPRQPAR